MQDRIAELKANSIASDYAVQKFKAEKGLVTADGRLVSDQQMMELDSQMVLAHSDTARAEARFNQIQDLLKSGQTDGAVTDSLGNPIITDLRQKYLVRQKLVADLESKLGSGHLAVVNARREMEEYRRLIFEELQRIAESYRSEGDVARAKEASLNKSMQALVGLNAGTNETMVQLRELERESESYKTLYQTFLQRYQEAIQQQSFPMTEARVITAASRPAAPSYPKRSLILAFSLVVSLSVGSVVGAVREYRDRVFRLATQVRDDLGLDFLGMLPAVRQSVAPNTFGDESSAPGHVVLHASVERYSIDHPLSSFSETLRSMKVAADLALGDRKPKIIGVISALPNEGKSTVSKNFASLLAHLGAKTLLIDGDLRNPGLSRNIAGHAEAGILEAIRGERDVRELLLLEPDSGMFFLPAVVRKRIQHTSEVLSSARMRGVLEDVSKHFDYVIVDLPPLGPVVDVRAASGIFDAFVFVIEWGRTARTIVQTTLASDDLIYDKCIGVVFNKVQMDKISLYEGHGSRDYYYGRYSKYYRTEEEPV